MRLLNFLLLATALLNFSSSASAAPLTADELSLIDEGFHLFTTETFDGNGRTCSTCHIPSKNYNITPPDIAALSQAERDLVLASNVPDLENATLVEKLALFNINEEHAPGNGNMSDGPFRASMTIAGLGFTTANQFCTVPAGTLPGITQCGSINTVPNERTNEAVNDGTRRVELGWAGDGGIGVDPTVFPNIPASADCIDAVNAFVANPTDLTAALRAFSLGAVRTHDTLRLDRVPGTDFRCPTPRELDALAAFQRWLGRRMELDLNMLTFKKGSAEFGNDVPIAEQGKALFMSNLATCNRCHFNAGASGSLGRVLQPDFTSDDPNPPEPAPSVPGANKNSHTSTDLLRISEVSLNSIVNPVVIPRDAGDRRERGGVLADGNRAGGFNMQPLVEAARKKTFFHNNGFVGSVEDAALFYFTPTFDASQGGSGRVAQIRYCAKPGNTCPNNPVKRLSGTDALAALGGTDGIDKLGFFLRSLSAVYSIADCERLVDEMIQSTNFGLSVSRALLHCQFALDDVRTVLSGARVDPMPYQLELHQVDDVEDALDHITSNGTAVERLVALRDLDVRLRKLRNSIASTPELQLAPSSAGAPVMGAPAAAVLVIGLFAVAAARLRRRSRNDG